LDIKDDKPNIGDIFTDNKAIRVAYWEYIDLGIVIEVEVKLVIETDIIIAAETLLNTMSITL